MQMTGSPWEFGWCLIRIYFLQAPEAPFEGSLPVDGDLLGKACSQQQGHVCINAWQSFFNAEPGERFFCATGLFFSQHWMCLALSKRQDGEDYVGDLFVPKIGALVVFCSKVGVGALVCFILFHKGTLWICEAKNGSMGLLMFEIHSSLRCSLALLQY